MNKLLAICLVALVVAGCSTTQRRGAYNTLYSVHVTTDAAFSGYLDLVVKGQVRTNDVPSVAKSYGDFQAAFTAAVALAEIGAPATSEVLALSADVINKVGEAKEAK